MSEFGTKQLAATAEARHERRQIAQRHMCSHAAVVASLGFYTVIPSAETFWRCSYFIVICNNFCDRIIPDCQRLADRENLPIVVDSLHNDWRRSTDSCHYLFLFKN